MWWFLSLSDEHRRQPPALDHGDRDGHPHGRFVKLVPDRMFVEVDEFTTDAPRRVAN
jgi:hypothetical protein